MLVIEHIQHVGLAARFGRFGSRGGSGNTQKGRIEHFNTLITAWLKEADDPFDFATALTMKSAQPA
jgi:hypothetical protein